MRKSWYVWFFQLPALPEKRLVQNNYAFIDKLYSVWSPNWDYEEADVAEIKKSLSAEGGVQAALGYYRAMIRGMSMQQLRIMKQQTSVPTLLIAGESDGSIGIEQFDNMKVAYTGFFRFISYSRVGHFPHRENVHQLAADIREFIKQCR
jgi:pimeloyl-ACP methyl ester carboxylesterase